MVLVSSMDDKAVGRTTAVDVDRYQAVLVSYMDGKTVGRTAAVGRRYQAALAPYKDHTAAEHMDNAGCKLHTACKADIACMDTFGSLPFSG